jgi:hypothetical protein
MFFGCLEIDTGNRGVITFMAGFEGIQQKAMKFCWNLPRLY